MVDEGKSIKPLKATPLKKGLHDPFAVLNAVVKGEHKLSEFDVTGLANNKIAMQILEAARISSETGKTVVWRELYKN